ncbi:hypothetical protein BASA61_006296 [Batrachochytrium salamandrivorans]|nr:hypothetical protein BASA62_008200 [Batrachochytrium salamandrivorans]KAH6573322.1 hypothetical protein BASA60_006096 [Batrachochytrium salamandrivorans]KAH6587418.1 hypothetical protein BASA61_006296 [Batrachochytrium salamandrivorans]
MRVNALVVAAMVITSVNAGLFGKTPSGVENNGGRSKPAAPLGLEVHYSKSGLSPDSSGHESASVLPQESQRHKPAPGLPPDSPGHGSASVFPLQLPRHDWIASPPSDATEKNPPADTSTSDLFCLRSSIMHLDSEFQSQFPHYYRLMKAKNREDRKNGENKNDKSDLKAKEAQAWFALNGENNVGLTSIAHLVVECEQVTGHRIQSGLVPAIQKSRLRLLGRALDPGVENVYTWLRGGVLNGEADLDQLLVGRDCGA